MQAMRKYLHYLQYTIIKQNQKGKQIVILIQRKIIQSGFEACCKYCSLTNVSDSLSLTL